MPKIGLDEQEPDRRPVTLGNAAMDAGALNSPGSVGGKSGGSRVKDSRLNLGGLSSCVGTPAKATALSAWQHGEKGREKSAEAIVAAGIEPWPKPFNNLRSTRDTELRRAGVPDYKVDAWLGHSLKVAKKHYLQLIDEDYLIAAGLGALPSVSPATAPEVQGASKSSPMPEGVVLYDRDLKKRTIGSSVNWAFGGLKWQASGKDVVERGKKNDKAIACNTLQAVTQSLDVDGFVRDSASYCSLLQEIKTPRLGLEPRTCELTARRSTN